MLVSCMTCIAHNSFVFYQVDDIMENTNCELHFKMKNILLGFVVISKISYAHARSW